MCTFDELAHRWAYVFVRYCTHVIYTMHDSFLCHRLLDAPDGKKVMGLVFTPTSRRIPSLRRVLAPLDRVGDALVP